MATTTVSSDKSTANPDFNAAFVYDALGGTGSYRDRVRKEFILAALQARIPEWRKLHLDDAMECEGGDLLPCQRRLLILAATIDRSPASLWGSAVFRKLGRLGEAVADEPRRPVLWIRIMVEQFGETDWSNVPLQLSA